MDFVQTIIGPKPIDDVSVGDAVCSIDGGSTLVTAVQCRRSVAYRINFTDDSQIECSGSQLMRISSTHRQWKDKVVDVQYILANHRSPSGRVNFWMKPTEPLAMQARSHLISPYALGVLIGDGSLTNQNVSFVTMDSEILLGVKAALPPELILRQDKCNPMTYRIIKPTRSSAPNPWKDELKHLGVWGCRSPSKFIPDSYLYSSLDERWGLLRGLMDTDGTTEKTGRVVFYTTSIILASQVKWLVESLGGVATTTPRRTPRLVCWHVGVSLNNQAMAFSLSRKKERCLPRTKYPARRFISSVTPVGERECRSIDVDHPSRSYLVDHCLSVCC